MGLSAPKRESSPVQLDPAAIDQIAVPFSDATVAHVIGSATKQLVGTRWIPVPGVRISLPSSVAPTVSSGCP
jgi:hypothetical protein